MSEDPKALPEGNIEVPDTYDFSGAPWMNIPRNYGKHLMRLAESVEDTMNKLYGTAVERRRKDRNDEEAGELDEELIDFMMQDVPAALEDLGNEIERARELEASIARDDDYFGEGSNIEYHLSQDARPDQEADFLENYRRAEGMYRSVLQKFDKQIDGMELNEYLKSRYDLEPLETVDLPVPRHHGQ